MAQIDRELVLSLSGHLQTAHQVVSGLLANHEARGISTEALLRISAVPHVRQSEALSVLELLQQSKVVRNADDTWINLYSEQRLEGLGQALLGAQIYKELADEVIEQESPEIVLTRPRAPSRLDMVISNDASLSVHIENTDDAFASLAASATKSLTIMTPFLDNVGARWAIALFEVADSSISKELILRFLQDPDSDLYPEGFEGILPDLNRLGVKIYDFAVPRPDTPYFYETFHAKVVCADGLRAYVGSANLSRHSKETSMELGMMVSGRAALRVDSILEKVRGIAITY